MYRHSPVYRLGGQPLLRPGKVTPKPTRKSDDLEHKCGHGSWEEVEKKTDSLGRGLRQNRAANGGHIHSSGGGQVSDQVCDKTSLANVEGEGAELSADQVMALNQRRPRPLHPRVCLRTTVEGFEHEDEYANRTMLLPNTSQNEAPDRAGGMEQMVNSGAFACCWSWCISEFLIVSLSDKFDSAKCVWTGHSGVVLRDSPGHETNIDFQGMDCAPCQFESRPPRGDFIVFAFICIKILQGSQKCWSLEQSCEENPRKFVGIWTITRVSARWWFQSTLFNTCFGPKAAWWQHPLVTTTDRKERDAKKGIRAIEFDNAAAIGNASHLERRRNIFTAVHHNYQHVVLPENSQDRTQHSSPNMGLSRTYALTWREHHWRGVRVHLVWLCWTRKSGGSDEKSTEATWSTLQEWHWTKFWETINRNTPGDRGVCGICQAD